MYTHSVTLGGKRASRMDVNSIHVVLLGLFDQKKLHDSFLYNPLEIRVNMANIDTR
jgi:hypothetical protein